MDQVLSLVSALRLDTEFLLGGVKHRKHILKPKPNPSPERIKKRRPSNENSLRFGQDLPLHIEEESSGQTEGQSATQNVESPVPEEKVLVEIEEIWDVEPSSIIGQGGFGIVRFERRRPQMNNYTQTTHNQVRAVKEIRKSSTLDYMKELQAIAKFSQAQVHWNLSFLYGHTCC